jgi:hypothetical protein
MGTTNTPTNATGNEDPTKTVILVSDTGVYRLTKEKWEIPGNVLGDAAGRGIIDQLTTFGAYLSYVPPELAVGIGEVCIVVNVKSILNNNLPARTATAGATSAGADKGTPTTGTTPAPKNGP